MKHTPGPWVISSSVLVCDEKARIIAHCAFMDGREMNLGFSLDESVSNAKLVSAAPDLLEACKKLILHRHAGDIHPIDYQRIEQAIAKATAEGKEK